MVLLLESLILLLHFGVQIPQFLVVVLQGLNLKFQFVHLLVFINPLYFYLNLHLLHFLLCAKLVVINECFASCSQIMTVYNLMLFPFCSFSGPLNSHSVSFNLSFDVLQIVTRIFCMWWGANRILLRIKSIILYSLLTGVWRILLFYCHKWCFCSLILNRLWFLLFHCHTL